VNFEEPNINVLKKTALELKGTDIELDRVMFGQKEASTRIKADGV